MKEIKLDPRTKVFITSDTHYNHANIIKYCLRPQLSEEERNKIKAGEQVYVSTETVKKHNDDIINRTNEIVGPDDVLINAGDIASNYGAAKEYRERLKVKRIIVTVGNHDDEYDLKDVFGDYNVFERFILNYRDRKAVIDHFPGDSWEGSHKGTWQLYGHVHGRFKNRHLTNPGWLLSHDVGIDINDFRPIPLDTLIKMFDSRRAAWAEWKDKTYGNKELGGMAVT